METTSASRLRPLNYVSSARQTRLEELKLLRKIRAITIPEFNREVAKLNDAEIKMLQRRREAEEKRRKEQEVAFLLKLKQQEERRKAKQAEYNRLRKGKRQERKAQVVAQQGQRSVVFSYTYRYVYVKGIERTKFGRVLTFNGEQSLNIPGNQDAVVEVQRWIARKSDEIDQQSPIRRLTPVEYVIKSVVDIKREVANKRVILMKSVIALGLDGEPEQTWDSGKGTCVYDFLIWRYGNIKGCKKVCSYEALDEVFRHRSAYEKHYLNCQNCVLENDFYIRCESCKDIDSHHSNGTTYYFAEADGRKYYMYNLAPYNDSNPREDGVCSHQLEFFCEKIGCYMYALDEREQIISYYKPVNHHKYVPPLVFRIKDNHLYPILNHNKAIANKNRKSEMDYVSKEEKEAQEQAQENAEGLSIQVINMEENIKTPTEILVDTMKQVGKQVYPFKNIKFDSKGLRGFDLSGVRYLFDEDTSISVASDIAKINNEPYKGETTFNIIMKLMEENKYDTKSVFNPFVYDLLVSEGVKYRTQYGAVADISGAFVPSDGYYCFDINKCHSSILANPMSDWLVYDFNDSFIKYNIRSALSYGRFRPGLYYVETDDMTLLHSSNIYSHTILNKAMDEGVLFNPISMYLPSRKPMPRSYFQKILDAVKSKCNGDAKLMKVLTNIITGMLGKHSSSRYIARMNTDVNVVWNDFCDPEFNNNETFFYKIDEFYLYGYIVENTLVENNIPMYIQVLDQANIRLYDMTKATGCELVWRKTDSIIVRGNLSSAFHYDNSNVIGSYRSSEFPAELKPMLPADKRRVVLQTIEDDWVVYPSITNSNQASEVYSLLRKYKGICNVSRAGTGKSYNIMKIEEMFRNEFPDAFVKKIAFTNKACLNINGTTIHKFLKLDKQGRFKLDWLKSLNEKGILIMIDEISMIGQYLWRRLVELKKAVPNAHFLLCGDYRQVPPVEECQVEVDYFNSSAVKYLANYTKIEFSVRQRYDEALWDFAEKVWEQDMTDYQSVKTIRLPEATPSNLQGKNMICYFNATRKRINKMMNEFYADKAELVIDFKYIPEPEESPVAVAVDDKFKSDKQLQQDALIYAGLPVIAFKNIKDKEEGGLLMANNECFILREVDESTCVAVSKRMDENGQEEEHEISIKTSEFHKHFLLNYIATTHKSQGATIDNDLVVFDYDAMTKNIKYTAITRSKKLSQINIVV